MLLANVSVASYIGTICPCWLRGENICARDFRIFTEDLNFKKKFFNFFYFNFFILNLSCIFKSKKFWKKNLVLLFGQIDTRAHMHRYSCRQKMRVLYSRAAADCRCAERVKIDIFARISVGQVFKNLH